MLSQWSIQNPVKHLRWRVGEDSYWLLAAKYFCKMLHLRRFTGLRIIHYFLRYSSLDQFLYLIAIPFHKFFLKNWLTEPFTIGSSGWKKWIIFAGTVAPLISSFWNLRRLPKVFLPQLVGKDENGDEEEETVFWWRERSWWIIFTDIWYFLFLN